MMLENDEIDKFTHGRGIFLTKNYMDEVIYDKIGNQVTIAKKRDHKESIFYQSL